MLLRINETMLARGYLIRVLKNSITIKMLVSSKELATEFRSGESKWLPGVLPKHFPALIKQPVTLLASRSLVLCPLRGPASQITLMLVPRGNAQSI